MSHLKGFSKDSRGFTLAEVLVGIGLLSIIMGILGSALFQALGTQRGVVDDGLAINELRKGLSWLAEDVKMATSTNLAIGATSTSITLSWKDQFNDAGTTYTSSYNIVGDRLVRTLTVGTSTPASHTVAHRVVSASFSRVATSTVLGQFEVNAKSGETRTLSVKTAMRAAQ